MVSSVKGEIINQTLIKIISYCQCPFSFTAEDTNSTEKGGRLLDCVTVHRAFPWGVLVFAGGGYALAHAGQVR